MRSNTLRRVVPALVTASFVAGAYISVMADDLSSARIEVAWSFDTGG